MKNMFSLFYHLPTEGEKKKGLYINNNSDTHVEMVWWHYKVSLDIVLLQIMVSLLSVAVLNFVVTVEIDQGLLSNVYPSAFDYKLCFLLS